MPKIVNIEQLSQEVPAFTQASIRWLIFRAKENGLEESGAIIRLGRRVLIDEEKFVDWVRNHGARQPAHARAHVG